MHVLIQDEEEDEVLNKRKRDCCIRFWRTIFALYTLFFTGFMMYISYKTYKLAQKDSQTFDDIDAVIQQLCHTLHLDC